MRCRHSWVCHFVLLLLAVLPTWVAAQAKAVNPNYEHEDWVVPDDSKNAAVDRLEEHLAAYKANSSTGIVMFAHPSDIWADYSIPVWRGYCRHHGYDCFIWREIMVDEGCRHEWSVPLLLRLLYARVPEWKTIMLVQSNSMPVGYDKTVKSLLKKHVTRKRWKKDPVKERGIWCPLDCKTKDTKDGDCKSIFLTGCIFLRKPLIAYLLTKWWNFRTVEQGDRDCSVAEHLGDGLVAARQGFMQQFLFSNAFEDIHVDAAKYIALFYKSGRELQSHMHQLSQEHKHFRQALQDADKNGEL
mmetsp:Transcript_67289/g.161309  ORF Transcript_67289/g.161309 Transcript_67289/m.161309 type:complete len:299 (+) Transcript_67289:252-1148(+)